MATTGIQETWFYNDLQCHKLLQIFIKTLSLGMLLAEKQTLPSYMILHLFVLHKECLLIITDTYASQRDTIEVPQTLFLPQVCQDKHQVPPQSS